MTLKAPRPKRSHTLRPPKRSKPYARKGKILQRWTDEMQRRPQVRHRLYTYYPPAED